MGRRQCADTGHGVERLMLDLRNVDDVGDEANVAIGRGHPARHRAVIAHLQRDDGARKALLELADAARDEPKRHHGHGGDAQPPRAEGADIARRRGQVFEASEAALDLPVEGETLRCRTQPAGPTLEQPEIDLRLQFSDQTADAGLRRPQLLRRRRHRAPQHDGSEGIHVPKIHADPISQVNRRLKN